MVKISRYLLVVIAITGFAIALPKLYWMMFARPIKAPFVQYSAVDHDFIILRSDNGVVRTNTSGKVFTREEYEAKLPFMYTRQLLMSQNLPDSLNGVEMDLQQISKYRSSFRLKPEDIHAPLPSLYPLFESQSGRVNLEMPDDYFRISWRMEFINAKTNQIDEEKSRMFSAVLYHRGFQFPATSINGIPSTLKSCDEGYLVIDSADQLFHVKMVKGKPFVRKVDVPEGLKFKTIQCVDDNDKLYYAYLFSEDNHIYALTQYDYLLERFPVGDVNPDVYEIRIYGDLLNYNITILGEGFVRSHIFDRDLNPLTEYSESWPVQQERKEGKIAGALFPVQLSMTNDKSSFVNFYFKTGNSFYWLIISFLLAFTQYIIIRKRKEKLQNQFLDLVIICISGIFGFFAVNIFPNKFFR
ncbi:MAG: DUF4857 domain-containing protein [Draconibacterium sp.]